MESEILDGTGEGFRAKVDERGRLFSDSIAREQIEYAILTGNGYNVSTGGMTLTSDSNSAVGYFKYNGTDTAVIKEILVILGPSTAGTGNGVITLLKNPDAGTIITSAVPVAAASNRDFSSSVALNATAYKGAEGETLTGGETFAVTSRPAAGEVVAFDAAPIILRRGNSIGVTYTPPAGNTSQSVIVAGTIYIETVKI